MKILKPLAFGAAALALAGWQGALAQETIQESIQETGQDAELKTGPKTVLDGELKTGPKTADQTVFPEGSTFGIIPFEGSVEAAQFAGFADMETSASVMITELPLAAWEQISTGFSKPETIAQAGITAATISRLEIAGMEAVRIAGTQTKSGLSFPKCVVLLKGREKVGFLTAQIPFQDDFGGDACALIRGIAQRDSSTSIDEQLAALPFALSDMGGFRVVQTIGGSGAVLTRGPLDEITSAEQPVMIIASSLSANTVGPDKMAFSEKVMASFPGHELGERLDSAELTLAELPATRLVYEAVQENGTEITLVQWAAFRADGQYVRLIGIASRENWLSDYPNFERVANSLSFALPSE